MLPSYVSQLGYFFDTGSWIFSIHGESQNCILRGRQESGKIGLRYCQSPWI
jgi:hypothetical protein